MLRRPAFYTVQRTVQLRDRIIVAILAFWRSQLIICVRVFLCVRPFFYIPLLCSRAFVRFRAGFWVEIIHKNRTHSKRDSAECEEGDFGDGAADRASRIELYVACLLGCHKMRAHDTALDGNG